MAQVTRFRPNPFAPATATNAAPIIPLGVRVFDEGGDARFKGESIWITQQTIEHRNAAATHRYPGVAGQTVEPLGRDPIEVTLEAEYFGEGWQERKASLMYLADGDQTSGLLELPDGPQFEAFLLEATETRDTTMSGTSVRIRFIEDSHADLQWEDTSESDPMTAATSGLSVDDSDIAEDVAAVALALASPGSYTAAGTLLLTQAADAACAARFDTVIASNGGVLDIDSSARADALMLARYRILQATASA